MAQWQGTGEERDDSLAERQGISEEGHRRLLNARAFFAFSSSTVAPTGHALAAWHSDAAGWSCVASHSLASRIGTSVRRPILTIGGALPAFATRYQLDFVMENRVKNCWRVISSGSVGAAVLSMMLIGL